MRKARSPEIAEKTDDPTHGAVTPEVLDVARYLENRHRNSCALAP
jgi:hypothetical protein